MAITTTENINKTTPPVCSRCGHEGSLMVKDANGKLKHFDACPSGPAPEPEPVLIAHDPLDPKPGVSVGALERLQAYGVSLTREAQKVSPYTGVLYDRTVKRMRPVAEIQEERERVERYEAVQLSRKSSPLEPVAEPAVGNSSQKPLSASRRKPAPELEIDWSLVGIDEG